jgi:hypothetical protein
MTDFFKTWLILLTSFVVSNALLIADKPGECPYDPGNPTICLVECYGDYSCPGDKKCCTVGCHRSCHNPVFRTTKAPPVVKPGECPPYNPFLRCPTRPDNCTDDGDCKVDLKCCPLNCQGRQCTCPVKSGTCPNFRLTYCPLQTKDECKCDNDCKGTKKCCSRPCSGLQCTKAE